MMKNFSDYISEKFQVSKDNIKTYTYAYHPKNKDELIDCIKEKIEKEGLGTEDKLLNLNDIDTSEITDMSYLFDKLDGQLIKLSENGNFDISNWDVSNVENMEYMFYRSLFTGDISDWDVSNVTNMDSMFTHSKFNGNISDWDVSKVENMEYMFTYSDFSGKNGSISNWNVKEGIRMRNMFNNCPLQKNPPKWYKNEIN